MSYSDRVAPLRIGTKVRLKQTLYWPNTFTITAIEGDRYSLSYDGLEEAMIVRNKETLRGEFDYVYPWEYIKNYPKESL